MMTDDHVANKIKSFIDMCICTLYVNVSHAYAAQICFMSRYRTNPRSSYKATVGSKVSENTFC